MLAICVVTYYFSNNNLTGRCLTYANLLINWLLYIDGVSLGIYSIYSQTYVENNDKGHHC